MANKESEVDKKPPIESFALTNGNVKVEADTNPSTLTNGTNKSEQVNDDRVKGEPTSKKPRLQEKNKVEMSLVDSADEDADDPEPTEMPAG